MSGRVLLVVGDFALDPDISDPRFEERADGACQLGDGKNLGRFTEEVVGHGDACRINESKSFVMSSEAETSLALLPAHLAQDRSTSNSPLRSRPLSLRVTTSSAVFHAKLRPARRRSVHRRAICDTCRQM